MAIDLISDLIETVETGKHRQFQFLRNWGEYSRARRVRYILQLTVCSIEKSADKLFTKYCKSVAAGDADATMLLAYGTTLKCLHFYLEEYRIIADMIYEYEAYLSAGNYWKSLLFNEQRPYTELWDYRG